MLESGSKSTNMEPISDIPDPVIAQAIRLTLFVVELERRAKISPAPEREVMETRVGIGRAAIKRALASVHG